MSNKIQCQSIVYYYIRSANNKGSSSYTNLKDGKDIATLIVCYNEIIIDLYIMGYYHDIILIIVAGAGNLSQKAMLEVMTQIKEKIFTSGSANRQTIYFLQSFKHRFWGNFCLSVFQVNERIYT